MAVPVVADLVTLGGDARANVRERLDGVAGDEPGRADAALTQQVEDPRGADPSAEFAAGQRVGGVGLEVAIHSDMASKSKLRQT